MLFIISKKNSVEIEKQLYKSTSRFSRTTSIPQESKKRFFLPISLNEMVGVTNVGGRDMIFWDDTELWVCFKRLSSGQFKQYKTASFI